MAKLKIYNVIVDEETKVVLQDWYGTDGVCYKDISEFLDSIPEDDNQIDIRLHCPGGDTTEGWAIYDALRNSGKEISTTIEGECSSMATIILLAAPKERRYGYKNARMLIHNPEVCWLDVCTAERLTADEIEKLKGKLNAQQQALYAEQKRAVDTYVERTGTDAETLVNLMSEERFIDMEKAIELGFIAGTIAPNTASTKSNIRTKAMAKEKENVTIESRVLKKMLQALGLAKVEDVKVVDQQITAADGTEFTVEREEGDPQVGDKAYPDGTFVLEDGTTIVVEDEVITSITPAGAEATQEDPADEEPETKAEEEEGKDTENADDLAAKVEELANKVAELEAKVAELTEEKENAENEAAEAKAENEKLKAEAKTEDEVAILDMVAKAGGKEWLDNLKSVSSTFNAANRQFVEHQSGVKLEGETKTQRMIREQREAQQAKREAMKTKRNK